MNIYSELRIKIDELTKSGKDSQQIKVEGLAILKDLLRQANLKDRQQFFLEFERNKKLKIILNEE